MVLGSCFSRKKSSLVGKWCPGRQDAVLVEKSPSGRESDVWAEGNVVGPKIFALGGKMMLGSNNDVRVRKNGGCS